MECIFKIKGFPKIKEDYESFDGFDDGGYWKDGVYYLYPGTETYSLYEKDRSFYLAFNGPVSSFEENCPAIKITPKGDKEYQVCVTVDFVEYNFLCTLVSKKYGGRKTENFGDELDEAILDKIWKESKRDVF